METHRLVKLIEDDQATRAEALPGRYYLAKLEGGELVPAAADDPNACAWVRVEEGPDDGQG